MTKAEHATRIKRTLDTVHRALDAHHAALAAFAAEYGEADGVEGEIVALAAAPKNPPNND